MSSFVSSSRRTGAAAVAVAGLLVAGLVLGATAASRPAETTAGPNDAWLAGLDGKHRQFFDAPTPGGGIMLVHMLNYYDTYNKAYSVPDRDIDAVGTFYGATTFYGVNDAAWAKYRIGEFLETSAPAGANPWRTAPVILGMTLPQASIESLQKRGATFILCNNALSIFSGRLAKARGLDPAVVYEDLKASILPGVHLVPGMVVAVEQANARGLSYHRQ